MLNKWISMLQRRSHFSCLLLRPSFSLSSKCVLSFFLPRLFTLFSDHIFVFFCASSISISRRSLKCRYLSPIILVGLIYPLSLQKPCFRLLRFIVGHWPFSRKVLMNSFLHVPAYQIIYYIPTWWTGISPLHCRADLCCQIFLFICGCCFYIIIRFLKDFSSFVF